MKRLKSYWVIIVVYIQRTMDILHRYVHGIPNLKRSEITPFLFLGSQYNLIGLEKLKALGITGIVNMREHAVYTDAQHEGIKYLHLPTVDNTPPTIEDLLKGVHFIDDEIKNGGKVYVHCRQGLGRGPTMALAYLIKMGATFEDAFTLVKSIRTFIDPKPEQRMRLKELQAYFEKERELEPA
jgi:dual specificity MAP kinase phosphatase